MKCGRHWTTSCNRLLLPIPWCRELSDGGVATRRHTRLPFHCRSPHCEFGTCDHLALPVVAVRCTRPAVSPDRHDSTSSPSGWRRRRRRFLVPAEPSRAGSRSPGRVAQLGPLGSVAGLYEAGIETAIRAGDGAEVHRSTATIRWRRSRCERFTVGTSPCSRLPACPVTIPGSQRSIVAVLVGSTLAIWRRSRTNSTASRRLPRPWSRLHLSSSAAM